MKASLTARQIELLSLMPVDDFVFPGRGQDATYQKFERLGLVEGDLVMAKRNAVAGTTEFRRAYKILAAGIVLREAGECNG